MNTHISAKDKTILVISHEQFLSFFFLSLWSSRWFFVAQMEKHFYAPIRIS